MWPLLADIGGLMQNRGVSIDNTLKLPQSYLLLFPSWIISCWVMFQTLMPAAWYTILSIRSRGKRYIFTCRWYYRWYWKTKPPRQICVKSQWHPRNVEYSHESTNNQNGTNYKTICAYFMGCSTHISEVRLEVSCLLLHQLSITRYSKPGIWLAGSTAEKCGKSLLTNMEFNMDFT